VPPNPYEAPGGHETDVPAARLGGLGSALWGPPAAGIALARLLRQVATIVMRTPGREGQ
jgi:hypothetical protein